METRLDRYEGAKENKINQLRQLIEEADNIVFLGGAGVSTLRLLPALSIGRKEADCFLEAFKELINE